jgi:hypothetical protein
MDKDFEMSKNGNVDTCIGQKKDIFGTINVSFLCVCVCVCVCVEDVMDIYWSVTWLECF